MGPEAWEEAFALVRGFVQIGLAVGLLAAIFAGVD